jgi:metal-responsive CopG/Arc/MetJ family transcriptional regulator
MSDTQENKQKSALITFGKVLLDKMDKHLEENGFRSRSEYLAYLVRKDLDNAQS